MKKSEHDIYRSYGNALKGAKKNDQKNIKLNSFIIHIGNPEKIIAVSKADYDKFNNAKDKKNYGKVCCDIVERYSTVSPNDLWVIPT